MLSNVICKCRHNKSVGIRIVEKENINGHSTTMTKRSSSLTLSLTQKIKDISNINDPTAQKPSIGLRDLAFSFRLTPYITVENLLNNERLTALMSENEDTLTDDELDDSSSENEFII